MKNDSERLNHLRAICFITKTLLGKPYKEYYLEVGALNIFFKLHKYLGSYQFPLHFKSKILVILAF